MTRKAGFTLIELMVVVAIIAILMAILIPGLLRAKMAANETSAIGTIKTITSAQEQFRSAAIIDVDGDGAGEYGYLTELAGVEPYRASGCGLSATPVSPSFITSSIGTSVQASATFCGNKSGYLFRIFLPEQDGAAGNGIPEALPLPCNVTWGSQQSQRWVIYAWPTALRVSGNSCFFGNRQSEIYFADNVNLTMYDGNGTEIDNGNAALPVGSTNIDGNPDQSQPSVDGQVWRPAG